MRKMTFYCFTNECLWDYILWYFREYGSIYCGNCANCLSQFEEGDVTEIARDLSRGVLACRQRYGTNDEYAVVKLTGRSRFILEGDDTKD